MIFGIWAFFFIVQTTPHGTFRWIILAFQEWSYLANCLIQMLSMFVHQVNPNIIAWFIKPCVNQNLTMSSQLEKLYTFCAKKYRLYTKSEYFEKYALFVHIFCIFFCIQKSMHFLCTFSAYKSVHTYMFLKIVHFFCIKYDFNFVKNSLFF